MAYCTAAQIRKRVVGVTVAVMDDTDVGTHITRADNLINARISNRYSVPFTTVPPIVETLSIEISAYFVMTTLFTNDSQNKNEWVEVFKASIETLKNISDGKIEIIDSDGNAVTSRVQSIKSTMQGHTPVFDLDSSENWAVDSDLQDEISDARD